MEKEQRSKLQKATQDARKLLEEEFRSQLLQTYDIDVEKVRWAEEPGAHLQAEQRLIREKLVAWIEHRAAQISGQKEALLLTLREMAFTALNRLVALKLMEARELVRPCVSGALESEGFQEFTAVAQGLLVDQESSYRLYVETIFEDVGREVRVLFNPRDPASALWPRRTALLELLAILNRPELAALWGEDETIGWVYQYFNGEVERKQMREESSAPRNSRELAVRNQFFTPRYVVEFLTDNTLGRLWYEMRQGNTALKERCRYLVRRPMEIFLKLGESAPESTAGSGAQTVESLSQEELQQKPVHIPHRPLKDPREIRLLDPACGSMHFGLYAFDLFSAIYDEAWEIAHGPDTDKSSETFAPFATFAATFPDKTAFLRELPRLILERNIHGIDIDSRAAQIAGLSLWLRAQRAWHQAGVMPAERPSISRSNVVCAEPMPGEKELLGDFVEQQFPETERPAFAFLLEKIFDRMILAGEAGSLLRIEEEIRSAITEARALAQRQSAPRQTALFPDNEWPKKVELDLGGLNDEQFWQAAEQRIYQALEAYAEQAERDGGLRRRLFADDAAQGFALVDLCRKRYDVVVMNPPFGDASKDAVELLGRSYVAAGNDIGTAFVADAVSRWCPQGRIGVLLSTAPWFKPAFEKWRTSVFFGGASNIQVAAHLSGEVLDGATVNASPFILDASVQTPATVARLTRSVDLEADLGEILECVRNGLNNDKLFVLPPEEAGFLPNKPFCYWASPSLRRALASLRPFEGNGGSVRTGLQTSDEERFCRAWWEIPPEDRGWMPYSKSSPFSPFWDDYTWCERIGDSLQEVAAFEKSKVQGIEFFWKAGVTYPSKSVLGFNVRLHPSGCGFAHSGCVAFSSEVASTALLAFLGSRPVEYLISLFIGDLQGKAGVHPNQYEVGTLQRLPWPGLSDNQQTLLAQLGTKCVDAIRATNQADEFTRSFVTPVTARTASLRAAAAQAIKHEADAVAEITAVRREIDSVIYSAYGFTPKDEAELEAAFSDRIPPASGKWRIYFGEAGADLATSTFASMVISWVLGCTFGRWDILYATGGRPVPELPDPVAPLPVCPPGMLQGHDGLPLSPEAGRRLREEGRYPLDVAWDGILVDDLEHTRDLERRVHTALSVLWAGRVAEIQQEACTLLEVPTLREWFRRPAGFFADHLKRYSKSRRQAPIYWQLSAGSGSYSAWLYYHRFTQDTLYRILRDFVEPRIQQAERDQFELESQGSLSGEAANRLQEAQTLLQDLRIFKIELDLVAPLWNPNLNDGVIINHAILWRITPYTPWQKKCKECWDKLVKGDYDWAHLAFHLWPERVIPKCTTDRSLAIAHGLKERLWQETNNGNWLPRQLSEADLQALIAEHSNPAVKSALERFLAAPPPVAPTRIRASRSTRSSGSSTPRRARGSAAVVDAEATRQVLLALTAAPSDGLAKTAIADLIGVEANALTAVIKQLKESGQIDQLGERRGARYVLSEQGRMTIEKDVET